MALSDDFGGSVQLMAAVNDSDDVIGLLADAQTGMYGRAEGQWFTISPTNRYFIGATVYDVSEDYLPFFDSLDMKGQEPTLKQTMAYVQKDTKETE